MLYVSNLMNEPSENKHISMQKCVFNNILLNYCIIRSWCDLRFQVKADRSNKKLHTLQQASRHVNDMAAVVVTSTKQGQQQVSDHGERRNPRESPLSSV